MDEKEIKDLLDKVKAENEKQLEAFGKGQISKEDFETSNTEIGKQITELTSKLEELSKDDTLKESVESMRKEIEDLNKTQKAQGEQMHKGSINADSVDLRKSTTKQRLRAIMHKLVNSEAYDKLKDGSIGNTEKMTLTKEDISKAIVGVTGSHTGTRMSNDYMAILRDDNPQRKMHLRDVMNVVPTNSLSITGPVFSGTDDRLTMGADVLAENADGGESSFTTTEQTWGKRRIARNLSVSKDYFSQDLEIFVEYVVNRLGNALETVEDYQLYRGIGTGNNIKGLTIDAKQFTTLVNTYVATGIASVASEGGKALVTFAADHLMMNGDSLTIADATFAGYNAIHKNVVVKNATQVVLALDYTAEADTSAWTGSARNEWYQCVDQANIQDVLVAAVDMMTNVEFEPTAIVISTTDLHKTLTVKGTDAHYIQVVREINGVKTIMELPVIAMTGAIPTGHFLVGDFDRGVMLLEKTPLSVQFAEDVDTKKTNTIAVIAEEEIILPIFNPKAFMHGTFTSAKAELETP